METADKKLHRVYSTAIIHRDGRFLVIRKSLGSKGFPGKWTVPGGAIETGDYIDTPKTTADHWYFAVEKSLKREIMEEVGLEVGDVEYLLDMTWIRSDGVPGIILSFYCRYRSGEVVLNGESMDYAWVTREEAGKYDLIEGILTEVEMVDDILRGTKKERGEYRWK